MPSTKVLQLKITLSKGEIEPPVWREILVKNDIDLIKLHNIIQDAFTWKRSHLYLFYINDIVFEDLSRGGDCPYKREDVKKKKLSALNFQKGAEFFYTYDFGDDWEHHIAVKNVLPCDEKQKYPFCIGGKRNRPPENCGGPPGYLHLLEVLANKDHDDHEAMYEYYGNYDSEIFSIDSINKALSKYHPKKSAKKKRSKKKKMWVKVN